MGRAYIFPTDGATDRTWSDGDCRCFKYGGLNGGGCVKNAS